MKQKYIGSYEVKEVIGEGSFGKVYKGIDIVTNQEMALKFISRKYMLLNPEASPRRRSTSRRRK